MEQTEPVIVPPGLAGQTDGVDVDATQTLMVVTTVIVTVIFARPLLVGFFSDIMVPII
jgi:hypothetical protein